MRLLERRDYGRDELAARLVEKGFEASEAAAAAGRCVELGCDVKGLSEILGHSSVQITMNIYVHSSAKQKKDMMNLVCAQHLHAAARQEREEKAPLTGRKGRPGSSNGAAAQPVLLPPPE